MRIFGLLMMVEGWPSPSYVHNSFPRNAGDGFLEKKHSKNFTQEDIDPGELEEARVKLWAHSQGQREFLSSHSLLYLTQTLSEEILQFLLVPKIDFFSFSLTLLTAQLSQDREEKKIFFYRQQFIIRAKMTPCSMMSPGKLFAKTHTNVKIYYFQFYLPIFPLLNFFQFRFYVPIFSGLGFNSRV